MPESGIDSSSYDRTLSFPESWRTRLGRIVLSRPVGVLAGAALLLIFLGCMSLSIGCKPDGDGTICQEGKVCLQGEEERDVYYPVPYASPPNLEISDGGSWYEIIEQKADHFRIRSKVQSVGEIHWHWKARGLKQPPSGGPPTVIVTPPGPPTAPPPPTSGSPAPLPAPTPIQTP